MLRQCPNTFVSVWFRYATCCFWRHMEEARRQYPSHLQSGRYYQLSWCFRMIWKNTGKVPFLSKYTHHSPEPIFNIQFLKWIGSWYCGAVANASMMWSVTIPTFSSASASAVYFLDLFIYGRSQLATFNKNDRSKITLYLLLLCSIIISDESFKFNGRFYFMSSHLTMVANPCADFSCSLAWIFEIVSSSNVDE